MYHREIGKHHAGFVLIMVLLVMQILTLGGVWILTKASMALKSSRQLAVSHAMFVHAEMAEDIIERRILKGELPCQIAPMPVQAVISALLGTDPLSKMCSGSIGSAVYYYRVAFLGRDPCLHLGPLGHTAGFVRLTLLLRFGSVQAPMVLQTVLVRAFPEKERCIGQERHSVPGRVAWQEVEVDFD